MRGAGTPRSGPRGGPRAGWTLPLALPLVCLLALSLIGCGAGPTGDGPATDGPSGGTAPATEGETAEAGRTVEEDGEGEDEEGFALSAEWSGGTPGAADRLAEVRFQVLDGYERVILEFEGGDAAGVPEWDLSRPPQGGYVRLRLPGVDSTELSDRDLLGMVMTRLYVVRAPEGGLFVDVFALDAFRYRVMRLPGGGGLAVDFRQAENGFPLPPTFSERAVVVSPREAETVGAPVEVEGYTRSFEARTTVELQDGTGETLDSRTVRATDWAETWGHLEATLDPGGYRGPAVLRVGERSPRDGAFEGVEVPVSINGG